MATLVTIAPKNRAPKMIPLGWVAGRSNDHTVTLSRAYADLGQTAKAATALPKGWVWAIEDVIQG